MNKLYSAFYMSVTIMLMGCFPIANDTRIVAQDDLVTVKYSLPTVLISPHQDGRRVLYFRNQSYDNPIGVGLRYVSIPGKDLILFVTKANNHDSIVHVLPIKGDGGYQINIGKSLFGQGLGRSDRTDPEVDYIESMRGDIVIFHSKCYGNSHRYSLDLLKRSFAAYD